MKLDPSADTIAARLAASGIKELYHFTDVENLPTVAEVGALCSKSQLTKLDVWKRVKPGGNELSLQLNGQSGNMDLLSIYFSPFAPMEYYRKRERHLCFCCLSPEIACWDGVLFTDGNATSTAHSRLAGVPGLDLVDFSVIKGPTTPGDPEWKRKVQSELLVPHPVPVDLIRRVCFVSQASLDYGLRMWRSAKGRPAFEVDTWFFGDSPSVESKRVEIPHIRSVQLTSDRLTKENWKDSRPPKTAFDRSENGIVTVLVGMYGLTGQEAKVVFNHKDPHREYTFPASTLAYWWPSVPIGELPSGPNTCEVYLGDVLWSALDFEVR